MYIRSEITDDTSIRLYIEALMQRNVDGEQRTTAAAGYVFTSDLVLCLSFVS